MPWVVRSDAAHRDEHCLEVQLPFLQHLLGDFELVPMVVGLCDARYVAETVDAVWGGDETLIVVSTDLSHYLSYEEAVTSDTHTSAAIRARAQDLTGEQACGAYALNGLLRVAAERGMTVDELDLRNSGDTSGDKTRVVGYGAYAVH